LYSDIVVNESVRRTDNVLRYLSSLLERLAEEPELLSTLQTYFDQQQRRKIAADVLGIHPNTLNHRLERIETLLGAKLDDASWIAKLHVSGEAAAANAVRSRSGGLRSAPALQVGQSGHPHRVVP